MSKMYESLEGLMQKTLQRGKSTATNARVKGGNVSSLDDEMEKLQKMVLEKLGGLKAAVQAGEAAAAGDARHAEQVIESLKKTISVLEAKVIETEDAIRTKESAYQSMEKSLSARIVPLEAKLQEAERILHERESSIRALEQSLTAKITNLESQLKDRENLLAGRDAQINDLKSQLQALTHGIKEMSSFFRQAEALAVVEEPASGAVAPAEPSKKAAKKPAASQPTASNGTNAARETMPPGFFDTLIRELTQVLGPMASVVVHERVASLGEGTEKFPKARVPELLETISQEIVDDDSKVTFRERLAASL